MLIYEEYNDALLMFKLFCEKACCMYVYMYVCMYVRM